ncbi:hypothetical protein CPT_Machias_125 [Staphylococcus phage Machias]|nr:hypothetical protein CPT_Machias_125 [Staphylococcus phage Machias]
MDLKNSRFLRKSKHHKIIQFKHNNINNDHVLGLSLLILFTNVYIRSDSDDISIYDYLSNVYMKIDGYLKGPLSITHGDNNSVLVYSRIRLPLDLFKLREYNVNTRLYTYILLDNYETDKGDLIQSVVNASDYIIKNDRIKLKIIIDGIEKDIGGILKYFDEVKDEKEIKKYLVEKNFK